MRSIELFAGCGGLALGLSQAGFEHDLVVERDAQAVATLKENYRQKVAHVKQWKIFGGDTRDIDFSSYKNIDLVSGGPPCQPFSIGGKHLGPQDERNMWPEAIRAVREILPKAFVFENVRGLLRPAFSDYLEYIQLQLTYPQIESRFDDNWKNHLKKLRQHNLSKGRSNNAYKVITLGINAADYGAAQKRHRAIVLGIASEYGNDWVSPLATHSHESLTWAKYIKGDYWQQHGINRIIKPASMNEKRLLERLKEQTNSPDKKRWKTIRDALRNLPTPAKDPSIQGHWQHPGARIYPNHTGSQLDEPAKALKAGDHGVPGGENILVNGRGGVRYFTIREMARLQGFPDNYIISGSWKAATRQLGNAVPIAVGKSIGKEIALAIAAGRRKK